MKFIIIAAGQGSRLRSETNNIPKTLTKVHDIPIIDILLNNCSINNINEIIIITGYNPTPIRNYLIDNWNELNIRFIHNDEWNLENGVSVLKAKTSIQPDEEFMISMSDHLYFSDLLKIVMESQLNDRIVNVGLDLNTESIFDIDDGMKVRVNTKNFIISKMSKNIDNYNAIDVGLFKCNYEFFSYLEEAYNRNQCSLSNGCNALIPKKLLGGIDIGNKFWLDIDTPEALLHATNNEKIKNLVSAAI